MTTGGGGERTPPSPDPGTWPGLCRRCRHARVVESDRGSRFWLCRRSETDPDYPRYPTLPVLECDGFEARPPTADPGTRPEREDPR